MPFRITVLPEWGAVEAIGEGSLRLFDFLEGRARILAQSSFEPDMDLLLDLTNVSELALGFEDVHYLSRSRAPFSNDSRCAIVAPRDDMYGLARMFELLKDGERQVRVFREPRSAWLWLGHRAEECRA